MAGGILFADWSRRWLTEQAIRKSSAKRYRSVLESHLIPELGARELEDLTRKELKAFLLHKRGTSGAPSARMMAVVLSAVLKLAVEEEMLEHNPADGLTRALKLYKLSRNYRIKALKRDELAQLLAAARRELRYYYPLVTLAWTGMRLGELRALELRDVCLEDGLIHIDKSCSDQVVTATKTERPRTVEIPTALVYELETYLAQYRPKELAKCRPRRKPVPWVFFSREGNPFNTRQLQRAMKRFLRSARLPTHHSVHSFRHTYASLLLQQGEPAEYVQRQLGHRSISTTVDVYGKWLRISRPEAVETLARTTSPERQKPARQKLASVVRFR